MAKISFKGMGKEKAIRSKFGLKFMIVNISHKIVSNLWLSLAIINIQIYATIWLLRLPVTVINIMTTNSSHKCGDINSHIFESLIRALLWLTMTVTRGNSRLLYRLSLLIQSQYTLKFVTADNSHKYLIL